MKNLFLCLNIIPPLENMDLPHFPPLFKTFPLGDNLMTQEGLVYSSAFTPGPSVL